MSDSRDVSVTYLGSPLRDAAVDPRPEDYLAPVGAGTADPHGSEVVAPEIHASGPKGIRPGNVPVDDPRKQEKREADHLRFVVLSEDPAPAPAPSKS